MAVLLVTMSAIPHLQHHMTGAHGQPAAPNLSHSQPDVSVANKRPKLSLQTTSLTNSYATASRGVVPNTAQAAYTPTTVNTLANTWDLTIRPSPISRTESPRPSQAARIQTGQQPYIISLPFGLRPILKNSPLPPRAPSVSASPRDARRRAFFPQPKRVSFEKNLDEFIENRQYTARHSDLTSSEDEGSDEEQPQDPSALNAADDATSGSSSSPPPCRKRKVRRDSGIYVDTQPHLSSTASTTADDDANMTPSSNSKRRKWQWASAAEESIPTESAPPSSDSETVECEETDSMRPLHVDQATEEACEAREANADRTPSPPSADSRPKLEACGAERPTDGESER